MLISLLICLGFSVVSTQEPGRRRSDSENGDSLDSIVNGDLEVNVDIEMDNEQFHLEADALLPDSSDAVGSLHGSLGSEVGTASSAQRTADGNEVNGGGSFMNSDGGTSQPSSKGGLSSEPHEGVIDTNENATDGDIAAPLLEASLEASSSSATSTASAVAERTEKSDEIEPAPLQEEAESTATEDKEKGGSCMISPASSRSRPMTLHTHTRDLPFFCFAYLHCFKNVCAASVRHPPQYTDTTAVVFLRPVAVAVFWGGGTTSPVLLCFLFLASNRHTHIHTCFPFSSISKPRLDIPTSCRLLRFGMACFEMCTQR